MRLLFAGTPQIAIPSLQALSDSAHEVAAVLTAPDRPVGRGRRLVSGPVKELALELGIPVLQPGRLGREAREAVQPLAADLLVCVAYGKIFGPRFLELFPHGGINLHPSLLPLYRGPAPIPAAILAGDAQTGVTIQTVAPEMDAGDILAQRAVKLDGTETTGTLSQTLGKLGAGMLVEVVTAMEDGSVAPTPQGTGASYTSLIRKSDGEISWDKTAQEIERQVRAFSPWPLAHTTFKGQRLNILEAKIANQAGAIAGTGVHGAAEAAPGTVFRVDTEQGILVETGNGLLALTRLQLQSRKALSFASFLNGVPDFVGAVLGG